MAGTASDPGSSGLGFSCEILFWKHVNSHHALMAEALGVDWGSWSHLWHWVPHSICSINRRSSRPGFGGLPWKGVEASILPALLAGVPY